jgi:hypothetical protein
LNNPKEKTNNEEKADFYDILNTFITETPLQAPKPDNTKENDTPEKVQQKIDKPLALLMEKGLVGMNKNKYFMTNVSTLPKIIAELRVQIKLGKITVPATDDIGNFIVAHIRDKKGLCISKDAVDKAITRASEPTKTDFPRQQKYQVITKYNLYP